MNGNGKEGFTLLETIIAFLILGIAMGVAVQTISVSASTIRRSEDLEAASLILSRISAQDINLTTEEKTQSESEADSEWTITSRRLKPEEPDSPLIIQIAIWPRGEEGPRFDYVTIGRAAELQE